VHLDAVVEERVPRAGDARGEAGDHVGVVDRSGLAACAGDDAEVLHEGPIEEERAVEQGVDGGLAGDLAARVDAAALGDGAAQRAEIRHEDAVVQECVLVAALIAQRGAARDLARVVDGEPDAHLAGLQRAEILHDAVRVQERVGLAVGQPVAAGELAQVVDAVDLDDGRVGRVVGHADVDDGVGRRGVRGRRGRDGGEEQSEGDSGSGAHGDGDDLTSGRCGQPRRAAANQGEKEPEKQKDMVEAPGIEPGTRSGKHSIWPDSLADSRVDPMWIHARSRSPL
jgi:hypothetical protein